MSEQLNYSGTERAAVLLMTLGEAEASQVLKHMSAREVQRLGVAMAQMKDVSKDAADDVLSQFVSVVEEETSLGVGTEAYIRKVLVNAFGESKADAFIDRILIGEDASGLEALKWMSSESVAEMISDEHPQIIAIVLAYLDSDQAAHVVELLPEEIRSEVVMRVAKLDDVQQSALAEIEALIEKKANMGERTATAKIGGDKVAADILNALQPQDGDSILGFINEQSESLGQRISEKMFMFESLLSVDDRGIQALLREVSNDLLVVALKGTDQAMQDKIFGNMSKRAAQLLSEDLEVKGPVRLSEVETAQREILTVARRMADAGDLDLGTSGEEYV